MANNRVTFGSKLGVVLATVGCAVGLGSVALPYMLGANGGAAFLLVYISFHDILGHSGDGNRVFRLAGIPVVIRWVLSRRLAPGTKWCWIGYNGILAAFLIIKLLLGCLRLDA